MTYRIANILNQNYNILMGLIDSGHFYKTQYPRQYILKRNVYNYAFFPNGFFHADDSSLKQ